MAMTGIRFRMESIALWSSGFTECLTLGIRLSVDFLRLRKRRFVSGFQINVCRQRGVPAGHVPSQPGAQIPSPAGTGRTGFRGSPSHCLPP